MCLFCPYASPSATHKEASAAASKNTTTSCFSSGPRATFGPDRGAVPSFLAPVGEDTRSRGHSLVPDNWERVAFRAAGVRSCSAQPGHYCVPQFTFLQSSFLRYSAQPEHFGDQGVTVLTSHRSTPFQILRTLKFEVQLSIVYTLVPLLKFFAHHSEPSISSRLEKYLTESRRQYPLDIVFFKVFIYKNYFGTKYALHDSSWLL